MNTYYPIKMIPYYKSTIWGGNRLKDEYHKLNAPCNLAECWELSLYPNCESKNEQGQNLYQINDNIENFFGLKYHYSKFPILVKLIDTNDDSSIQVHPSNENIVDNENGKVEIWYIIDAKKDSYIYYGLNNDYTKEEIKRAIENNTITNCLNKIKVKTGDFFPVMPGTIHAFSKGIILGEIQQSSDTTFRVYDYLRKDNNGNLRPLHIQRALEVINYQKQPLLKQNDSNETKQLLFECDHFKAYKLSVNGQFKNKLNKDSFEHLLCIDGECEIETINSKMVMKKGESYFIPCSITDYQLIGEATILISTL